MFNFDLGDIALMIFVPYSVLSTFVIFYLLTRGKQVVCEAKENAAKWRDVAQNWSDVYAAEKTARSLVRPGNRVIRSEF